MVSDFIFQETGSLCLSEEQWEAELAKPEAEHLPCQDAHVVIYPTGKEGGDDYWNNDQMVSQVPQSFFKGFSVDNFNNSLRMQSKLLKQCLCKRRMSGYSIILLGILAKQRMHFLLGKSILGQVGKMSPTCVTLLFQKIILMVLLESTKACSLIQFSQKNIHTNAFRENQRELMSFLRNMDLSKSIQNYQDQKVLIIKAIFLSVNVVPIRSSSPANPKWLDRFSKILQSQFLTGVTLRMRTMPQDAVFGEYYSFRVTSKMKNHSSIRYSSSLNFI